jgi:hypothetical protein
MFKEINQKYKKQRMLAEAKELLVKNGYKLLLETPVENFEDTDSKQFLLDVINNLEEHGYVSREAITKLDQKLGYVWNELNKLAHGFSIDKILNYLTRLGLYKRKVAA